MRAFTRVQQAFSSLIAGVCVYLVVAACGSLSLDSNSNADSGALTEAGSNFGHQDGSASGGEPSALQEAGSAIADAMGNAFDAAANPVDPANAYESGTRIKAKWLVTPDGARQFNGWRDTLRGEDCSFQKNPNGTTSCLPIGAAGVIRGMYFSDLDCTEALDSGIKSACNPDPQYANVTDVADVCSAPVLSTLTLRVPAPTAVYSKSGENCIDVTDLVDSYNFYVTSPIPLTAFAEAMVRVDE